MSVVPFVSIDGKFWRMLSIRWQTQPYGSGSHMTGGRWNAIGTKALYLATDHATAIGEYHRSLVRPGTLATYEISSNAIVDLTDAAILDRADIDRNALTCAWQAIYAVEKKTPPSWTLADRLIAQGADGALVPSVQNSGGTNLVLWRWQDGPGEGAAVRVVDPDNDLTPRA